ncbi:hypothetical protein [Methylobacterium oxalidis]|uniref:hypothetical protein n=1 Tax=Methylobacterium oxalidis TaxID=944322 RepID=UPI00331560BE
MPDRSLPSTKSESLLAEACTRLPLFEDLTEDTIQRLSASGYGRGFLTASLRARLRKAGFRDLGHLAQSTPDEIAKVRKFGPVRVEAVRAFLLDKIARALPGARERQTREAIAERRLARLRDLPADRLALHRDEILALSLEGATCADLAQRSRLELLRTGVWTSSDLDRFVADLAQVLGEGREVCQPAAPDLAEIPDTEARRAQASRAALLAERDREWEAAAPASIGHRAGLA